LLGWFILIFLPRRWKQLGWIPQFAIPFGLSMLYVTLVLTSFGTIEGGGFGSLEQVKILFANDMALLGGWVHYLAFDLFIGAWIARKADEISMSRILQAPILLSTFMLGPLGLLLFLTMRGFYKKELTP
jgi:hypothetical protein